MSEKDNVFLNHPTGGEDYSTREQAESQDVASLQTELDNSQRIADGMFDPFAANRVPTPGSGDGAGGRVNRTDWPA